MRSRYRSRRSRRRSPLPVLLVILLVLAAALFFLLRPDESAGTAPPVTGEPDSNGGSAAVLAPSEDTPSTASPDPSGSPEPEPEPLPPLSEAPWNLTLANKEHPLPADWEVNTMELPNGLLIDARVYDALMAMLADCKAEGLDPIVCSAYRTVEKQTQLFETKIDTFLKDGLSYDEAYLAASQIVAIPGTSEHNLGLSVDICAASYQLLDDAQAQTPEQLWLMEHCVEYGFILRYPREKQHITGIIWEPWHYRYVGKELAREITDSGLCLEEYMALHYDLG